MKRNLVLTVALLILAGFSMSFAKAKEEPVALQDKNFSAEEMQEIADYADIELLSEVSHRLGSATPQEYVTAYLEVDPEFATVLLDKFNVKVSN